MENNQPFWFSQYTDFVCSNQQCPSSTWEVGPLLKGIKLGCWWHLRYQGRDLWSFSGHLPWGAPPTATGPPELINSPDFSSKTRLLASLHWNTLSFSLISFMYLQGLRSQTSHQEEGKSHLRAQYTNTARLWKVSHTVAAGYAFPKYSRNTSVTDELSPTSRSQCRSHDQCRIIVWLLYLSMRYPPTFLSSWWKA